MNLYVSNLSYALTDDELRSEFAVFGTVSHARVVKDRETGRSRGFGFVEMPNDAEAQAAIQGLDGANVAGRPCKVVVARPKEERPAQPFQNNGGGTPFHHRSEQRHQEDSRRDRNRARPDRDDPPGRRPRDRRFKDDDGEY